MIISVSPRPVYTIRYGPGLIMKPHHLEVLHAFPSPHRRRSRAHYRGLPICLPRANLVLPGLWSHCRPRARHGRSGRARRENGHHGRYRLHLRFLVFEFAEQVYQHVLIHCNHRRFLIPHRNPGPPATEGVLRWAAPRIQRIIAAFQALCPLDQHRIVRFPFGKRSSTDRTFARRFGNIPITGHRLKLTPPCFKLHCHFFVALVPQFSNLSCTWRSERLRGMRWLRRLLRQRPA